MILRAAQCCFIVQGAHPFADSWTLNEILLRRPSFSPSAVSESPVPDWSRVGRLQHGSLEGIKHLEKSAAPQRC